MVSFTPPPALRFALGRLVSQSGSSPSGAPGHLPRVRLVSWGVPPRRQHHRGGRPPRLVVAAWCRLSPGGTPGPASFEGCRHPDQPVVLLARAFETERRWTERRVDASSGEGHPPDPGLGCPRGAGQPLDGLVSLAPRSAQGSAQRREQRGKAAPPRPLAFACASVAVALLATPPLTLSRQRRGEGWWPGVVEPTASTPPGHTASSLRLPRRPGASRIGHCVPRPERGSVHPGLPTAPADPIRGWPGRGTTAARQWCAAQPWQAHARRGVRSGG